MQTERGKPFTPADFGNWLRERRDGAGVQVYSAVGCEKRCKHWLIFGAASWQ
jgi:hypothetical protein